MKLYRDQNSIHETEQDRFRQKKVLNIFSKTYGLEYEETPALSGIDAILKSEFSRAVAEVKVRNIAVDLYPTYIIDAEKIINGLKQAGEDAFLLIVAWKDDIRYLHVSNYLDGRKPQDVFVTKKSKRSDRDEKADMVFHIPISLFTPIYPHQYIGEETAGIGFCTVCFSDNMYDGKHFTD